MITVDLNNTNDLQRKKFNETLEKIPYFSKIKGLTTTWEFSYNHNKPDGEVFEIIKETIKLIAMGANIKDYEAAVMLGISSPEVFGNE